MTELDKRVIDDVAWAEEILARVMALIPGTLPMHNHETPLHALMTPLMRRAAIILFGNEEGVARKFAPFGDISMPYIRMGAVDSADICHFRELMLFSFFWINRQRYRRVADLGANVGWHSIILARCGYEVKAWEPDPDIFAILCKNLQRNGCASVAPTQRAVSSQSGVARFVRVHGNWTSSHIEGAKSAPYGKLERFDVELDAYSPIAAWADLIKMDIEGHEADLLCATTIEDWVSTDVIAEIGTAENAERIYQHMRGLGVSMFSQKVGWQRVMSLDDFPIHYSEGCAFITCKDAMPW
jgi:FkbM family methyltransferase